MRHYTEHLILCDTSIKDSLKTLNKLAGDAIIFVIDKQNTLIGSLTDGDVRRGLLKGVDINQSVSEVIQPNPKYIKKGEIDIYKIIQYREKQFRIIPIEDGDSKVVNILNFRYMRSYLPIDAVIMAGGRGQRLRPMTDTVPKPLLKIGNKSIMEHNIERLTMYGVDDFWFSVKYLSNKIVDYFQDGKERNISIHYVWEDEPLGTIGSVSTIDDFVHDNVLISNSDILTNLDYEAFYVDFLKKSADFSVLTIPYKVSVPYAVLETSNGNVTGFKEKPTYTYYSNGGIYLMKRSMLEYIPKNKHFNATDLMEKLIAENKKVITYSLVDYWLDIGKHEDFEKAQRDIINIKF